MLTQQENCKFDSLRLKLEFDYMINLRSFFFLICPLIFSFELNCSSFFFDDLSRFCHLLFAQPIQMKFIELPFNKD